MRATRPREAALRLPVPGPTSSAFWLDVTAPDPAWQPVAAAQGSLAWGPYDVLGPAEANDQVRAVDRGAGSLLVLDVSDGAVISREPLPAASGLFGLDASGQHALLSRKDGVYAWTPGAPARRIGPPARQVAW